MKPWGQGLQGREEGCRGEVRVTQCMGCSGTKGSEGLGEDLSTVRCHQELLGRAHRPGSVEVTGLEGSSTPLGSAVVVSVESISQCPKADRLSQGKTLGG